MTASEKRIRRVKALYPDSFKRVREACVFAAVGIDLDDHAAKIVMAGKNGVAA